MFSKSSKPTQICFTACEDSINGKPCKCTGFPQSIEEIIDFDKKSELVKKQNDEDYQIQIDYLQNNDDGDSIIKHFKN